jgi:hypothetical protein
MVFRCWDQQLLEGWGCRCRESDSIPHRVKGSVHRAAASQALVGGGMCHHGHESLSGGRCEMGSRGCRGSLSGSWLAWLGSGLGFTLDLLHPKLAAHLFGKRALVLLHGFARCKLASAELALPVWGALGCLSSSLLALLPQCMGPLLCKSLLLFLGLGCYP